MEFKDNLLKAINEVKSIRDAEKVIIYGTQETLDAIKEYLPSDIPIEVLPDDLVDENNKNNIFLIPVIDPIEQIKFDYSKGDVAKDGYERFCYR